jgi:hypothetical protein
MTTAGVTADDLRVVAALLLLACWLRLTWYVQCGEEK